VFPLRIALPLALVAALLVAAPVAATGPVLRTASLADGHVQASVAGTIRTGAWRLFVRRPGAAQRLRVFIERGDIWWGGRVSVQRLVDGRWVTTERRSLDHDGRLDRTVCATGIRACVLGGSVRPPRPGAQRLAATFRLRGGGHWTITGAVRQASEPFILGPWIPDRADDLAF